MKVLLMLFLFMLIPLTSFSEELSFIVNVQNPANEISEEQLTNFFMKKARTWPNGVPVRFFDKKDDSEQRKLFLSSVIRKSIREVELYWIGQKLYTGNSAPLQVNTDSMMASMVSRFPGAIGYVSSTFPGAPGVKKIQLRRE